MENIDRQIGWLLQEKYPEINPLDLNGAGSGKRITAARRDVQRLKAGEPLDHIIGFVEFLDCKILVNKHVLIPRVETEFWVEEAIGQMSNVKGQMYCLDMFAGSGAIGIAIIKHSAAREGAAASSRANGADNMGQAHIMRHMKNAHVTFVDSEKKCVEQIKKNCQLNKIPAKRYKIIQSDIFEQLLGPTPQYFDYILANPPYIPRKSAPKIQKSVIDYEPHVALFGGGDGLDLIRRFLAAAKNRLNPNGKIFLEFDTPQKPAIEKILKKLKYKKWQFRKDQYGKSRYVVVE